MFKKENTAEIKSEYESFIVKIENNIAHVVINRPEKANAMHRKAWEELKEIFELIDETEAVRVVVLSGEGKHFCAGIDLNLLMSLYQLVEHECEGRKREKLRNIILDGQSAITAIEKCSKPVIAAVHNGCIGGGVDLVAACDMRYATEDAYFCIKEIEMGMVADLGTLQRLPKIIPYGIVSEMAYTGRRVYGKEAASIHLVNRCYENKEVMLEDVQKIAMKIASNTPLSVRGTKHILQYSREHSVKDSLEYMATWNASMLMSKDLMEAFEAKMSGREAKFMD